MDQSPPAARVADPSPGPGTALVTGAARGIGAAVAARLAAEGYRVVLADRCSGPDSDVVLGYRLASRDELDVRDLDAVRRVVSTVEDLRVVVTAAGVVWGGAPVWDMPGAAWQEVFDVNVTGTYGVIAAAVPRLLDQPEPRTGRIVALASAGASRGLPHMAAYSAAKHAVVGLVRSVAGELADRGVTINAIAPGSTRTPILRASAEAYRLGAVEEFIPHQPIGRLLDPSEIADAVAWLCSPVAAAVTGSVVAVDGGMTAV